MHVSTASKDGNFASKRNKMRTSVHKNLKDALLVQKEQAWRLVLSPHRRRKQQKMKATNKINREMHVGETISMCTAIAALTSMRTLLQRYQITTTICCPKAFTSQNDTYEFVTE